MKLVLYTLLVELCGYTNVAASGWLLIYCTNALKCLISCFVDDIIQVIFCEVVTQRMF